MGKSIMPFPWRLKKARKYDISTKNLFIVGVYLLDNVYLECTLNAESTGQECLNSIAQRIELTESHFFGLRYVTKKLHFHWVDLEKPLKKQLEKYAQQASPSHCLYFGVMFYVSGAHKIPDDVARYHYYLQLKNDVIDGRLPCSVEQAIRLAAYSLQADFGDYEPEKYSAEEYLLFPKAMMQDDATASELLSEAIAGHVRLQGIPPDRAELQYVKEVQMMDGYGAEYYSAKDESRKDLYLGTSYAGIFARYIDGQSTVYYRWNEIAKVNHSKKLLEVDTPKSSVQFQMEDTDTAKYVSRMAQLQRQFYKSSKANLSLGDVNVNEDTESQTFIDAQPVYIPPMEPSQHSQELGHSQTSLTQLQMQGYNAQEILQSSQQSLASSSSSQHQQEIQQQQQQQIHNFQMQQQTHPQMTPTQQPPSQPQPAIQHHNNIITIENENVQHGERLDSMTPTPDSDPVYVNRAALLPAYRPSPDYETVMRQRMLQQDQQQQQQPQQLPSQHDDPQQQQQLQPHLHHQNQHNLHHFNEINTHLGPGQVYVHPEGMAYSQPEIRQNIGGFGDDHSNYANVEALRNYSHSIYANIFHDNHSLYAGQGSGRLSNLAAHPTYSSPELNTEMAQQDAASFGIRGDIGGHQQSVPYHYKPPPPYPRTSSSTPDLAAQGGDQRDTMMPILSGSQDNMEVPNIVIKTHTDRSVEDMSSGLPDNILMALSSYPSNVLQNHVQQPQQQSSNAEERILGIDDDVDEFDDNADDKRSTLTRDSVAPVCEDATDGMNKMMSDDQDDTSSEHSYSTFHAKESEESSDDDTVSVQPKALLTQQKEEPKIQIRVLTAQEAPPPSKIKEEATLRESFRRLKIARVSSIDKNRQLQTSLKGVKETSEPELSLPPSTQDIENEEIDSTSSQTGTSENLAAMTPHMMEVLERLGAPPPYPGTPPVHNDNNPVNSNSNPMLSSNPTDNSNSSNILSKEYSNTHNINNNNTNKRELPSLPTSKQQQSQITVKRSSSVGTVPSNQSAPLLPPRRQLPEKPRAATFNLDTIVPVSKPGMVLLKKDPNESNMGTSVLKVEETTSLAGSKDVPGGSPKSNPKPMEDPSIKDDGASLHHDYSVGGSDSDSDSEHGSYDGPHMGPLKMAAMNGLTLSRSVVLSLMNDDSRAPTDDRRRMLESKISEGQVYIEFEKIPKKADNLDCNVATSIQNGCRNRFKDVLPYDASRVKLSPRNDNPDGYVNASRIKLTANEKQWLFIGTQAPLSNTAVDFWQMVWENKTDVIAMLTPFQEMGKSKCFVYWPQEPGSENKHKYRDFEVELQFTDDSLCYVTSRIVLRHCPTGQVHMVWHLQYTDWPDHGCPEDTYGFLGFVDEIESVARIAETESGRGQSSPVVIHCSAGVGRTGVVILTMVMKWCLEHNHNVDLPKALAGIRNQRMHMVQTVGQYRFIHDTLIQYLKNTRLI